ncbi:GTP-binding protein Di-Ras1 [Desmophyllum pertusum]|uniref:GTP-binding protein Di-Ras1 n=1 Tax=Desmophyllum pertusum TaxID=174260 RepID=A0A9X0CMT8_9CNID|nr:GTP-binding protein Di-Ras1 [Desmophyllum pertusum]
MRRIAIQKQTPQFWCILLTNQHPSPSWTDTWKKSRVVVLTENRKIPVIIVSNKSDLPNLSEPTFHNACGLKISACVYLEGKWRCQWLATSAKFNLNIDVIFHKLLDKLNPDKNLVRKKGSILKQILR